MAGASDSQLEVPLAYRLFFLYIEPVATAIGAYYGWFLQGAYLHMTQHPNSHVSMSRQNTIPTFVSTRESIILNQLANMYAVFALNEAIVLRATKDLTVWRVFLLGLLLADFGHLLSVHQIGTAIYYAIFDWNAMYWGNLGFVYIGASMRLLFLFGFGMNQRSKLVEREQKRLS